jgi:hypothetical protein
VCEMTSWANQDDKYEGSKSIDSKGRKEWIQGRNILMKSNFKNAVSLNLMCVQERERFVAYYDLTQLEGLIYIV